MRDYESPNEYIFPLEAGEWFILAYPGIEGHHRWTAATEHGYDITQVDSRGSWATGEIDDWQTGSVATWEAWYAYGKSVLAAADGKVVKVVDDVEFSLSFWNRQEGESVEEYASRIGARQLELFRDPQSDPAAVAGGNHIVIEHRGGEYSLYAHLAYGSIEVEEGQTVSQGQTIAELGGTGEIPHAHLHFQVGDSPDGTQVRTFPVQFADLKVNGQDAGPPGSGAPFEPGFFVTNRSRE